MADEEIAGLLLIRTLRKTVGGHDWTAGSAGSAYPICMRVNLNFR